ncbi:hypothetical protein KI387_018571 [Taxus chinensis]|uniref:Endonuclease/exonuclease/phosphatase domain-containing protein n=1 Tax=Taxus chinensis TaxID=29808 RepID=A0AA38LK20_TAXCH|nr:hypothetical protein KI387_018571 [Taxus chinensis]
MSCCLALRAKRLVGQSLEYDWRLYNNSNRAHYCNYPYANPDPNEQRTMGPMLDNNPSPYQQPPPPWGWPTYVSGESPYRAVNETNANFRRNEVYGERGRMPYYRGGSGNVRGQYSYPNAYSSANPNMVPRSFGRQLRAPPADDHRHWQYVLKLPPSQNERFIILSYNILADYLVRDHWQQLYTHIPHFILDWVWRKKRILLELDFWSPDIMCLQALDKYLDLLQELKPKGYGGVYKERTGIAKDGCAIFWRTSRFALLHEEYIEFSKFGLRDNIAQICVLQSKFVGNAQVGASHLESSGRKPGPVNRVVVCNIHVLFNPKRGEIKLGQVRVLLERAHAVSKVWDDAPVVIAGDFNCTPKSPLYDFLSKYELNISGLARNQISGQPESKPYFRHTPPNRNAVDLARMAGTILQSATGNKMVDKDKTDTNSPILRDSTSEENTPKDLTNASTECLPVPAEKDLASSRSKMENCEPGGTVRFRNFSEVREYQDERYMNEFERLQVERAGSSSEDCSVAVTSIRNHPVSVEQEVSAMDARKDQKRSLDSCSGERLRPVEKPTISSNEILQTNRHLCFQQNVKEDARGEEENSVITISKARESGRSTKSLLFLDETSPNEVKCGQSGHVSGSLEYCQLADLSRKRHSLSGDSLLPEGSIENVVHLSPNDSLPDKEGLAIDVSDDCKRNSLSANSRITLAMKPVATSSPGDVKETKEPSSLQGIFKENLSVMVEANTTNFSEATDTYLSGNHPELQAELCPKEVGREHAGTMCFPT